MAGEYFTCVKKFFYFIHIILFQPGILKKNYWKIIAGFICSTAYQNTCCLLVNYTTSRTKNYPVYNKDLGVFHHRANTALKRPCPEWKGRKVLTGGAQVLKSLAFSSTAFSSCIYGISCEHEKKLSERLDQ